MAREYSVVTLLCQCLYCDSNYILAPGAPFTAMPLGKRLNVHYQVFQMGHGNFLMSVHTLHYTPVKFHLTFKKRVYLCGQE